MDRFWGTMTWRLGLLGTVVLIACQPEEAGGNRKDEPVLNDRDGDSIADEHEGETDADADGSANADDLDADGDGIEDRVEAGDDLIATMPFDTDGDGDADFLDHDSDGNCVYDQSEGVGDPDADGALDAYDDDNDGDGILDVTEIGGACGSPDSDLDGTADYMDLDSDDDGVPDSYEAGTDGQADSDGDGMPDYLDLDSDNDGRLDGEEVDDEGVAQDLDGDGVYDFQDPDNDGDGLSDRTEAEGGTDPDERDTDNDGQTDKVEVTGGSNPLDHYDRFPGWVVEIEERSVIESSFDYLLTLRRVDLAMLIDVTTSMTTAAPASVSDLLTMAQTLTEDLFDPHVGVGVFSEFSALPMSSGGGDIPFRLDQQLTGDLDAAWSALAGVSVIWGYNVDWPEASMEALHQALTGTGYDIDCDGVYSSSKDVLPFISDKSDPFGGTGGQAYNSFDSSTGDIGGMGFRSTAVPIVLLVTDAQMRDPEAGYPTPGGCPDEAGGSDVIAEMQALGAYFIGLSVSGTLAVAQMTEIAEATNSYGDPDGSGLVPLVFGYTPGDAEFRDQLVKVISDLGKSVEIEQIWAEVNNDTEGFVTDIGPVYEDVSNTYEDGELLPFDLEMWGATAAEQEDTIYELEIDVVSERGVLETVEVIVVVPGREP